MLRVLNGSYAHLMENNVVAVPKQLAHPFVKIAPLHMSRSGTACQHTFRDLQIGIDLDLS